MSPETILDQVGAIEALHDSFDSISNPVQTSPVRFALNEVVTIEPPRSWPKEEKAQFMHLPVQIQNIIAAREKDRERTLRRAQNDAGDLRQELKRLQAAGASTSATTEKEVSNG